MTLVRAIVRELHVDAKIFSLQFGDHVLKRVAILSGNANDVRLNRSLDLCLGVFDKLYDFFGFVLRNSLLNSASCLTVPPAAGSTTP